MAERREFRRITYVVPSGASWVDLRRAFDQALSEYREIAGLDVNALPAADAVRVEVTGQETALVFDVIDGPEQPETVREHHEGTPHLYPDGNS